MGMYDTVRCRAPLPGWPQGKEFVGQSKDFQCQLDTIVIEEDGRIVGGWQDDDFTGGVSFYGDLDGVWYEYSGIWLGGKLVAFRGGPEKPKDGAD